MAPRVARVAHDVGDRWNVILWRQEELERAGYPLLEAMELAERMDIDLHEACDLVRRGCPVDRAMEILR